MSFLKLNTRGVMGSNVGESVLVNTDNITHIRDDGDSGSTVFFNCMDSQNQLHRSVTESFSSLEITLSASPVI